MRHNLCPSTEDAFVFFAVTLSLAACPASRLTETAYLHNDLHQFEMETCFFALKMPTTIVDRFATTLFPEQSSRTALHVPGADYE